MSRTRWFDIAAIALTAAVLAGLGFVSRPQHTPTITAAPSTVQVERPQPPAITRPSALIIGDSYAWGGGLAETSYGCMAAAELGWLCHLSGGPGTGYISGGPDNRFVLEDMGPSTSFDERLPGLAAMYKPDVVILDGGRNDLFAPRDAVFDAMSMDDRRCAPKLANGQDSLHPAKIPGPARRRLGIRRRVRRPPLGSACRPGRGGSRSHQPVHRHGHVRHARR